MNLRDFPAADNAVLRGIIADRIGAAGSIGFDEFMRLALYHPKLGYYFACDPRQDYQSSPNVHPVFGAAMARLLHALWRSMDRPAHFDVFEAGAGSGQLAADILAALRRESPDLHDACCYTLQDTTLSTGDFDRLERNGLQPGKIALAEALPDAGAIDGCILSNELLDALPFRRVRVRDGHLYEVNVALTDGRFTDAEVEPSAEVMAYFQALGQQPGEGCDAEVCLEASDWIKTAATSLRRGYVLTLDYGYEAPDLYAPWRKRGTLLTFYRHTSNDAPYERVGRQDITASVDFTTVRRAGEAAGLRTIGWASQAELLAALGIGDVLAQSPAGSEIEAYYALRRAVIELTDTSGLGRIRALLQGKDVPDTPPAGFLQR